MAKDPTDNPNSGTHLSDIFGKNPLATLIHTPGVKNIEKAYSRGGGAPTHQPAAGTRTDSAENVEERNKPSVSLEIFRCDYCSRVIIIIILLVNFSLGIVRATLVVVVVGQIILLYLLLSMSQSFSTTHATYHPRMF